LLLSLGELFLKTSLHEFKAFKEWILSSQQEVKPFLSQTLSQTQPLAIPLLEQFSYVFPKEIPHGLPPKRTIEHHIDLIHGAILANKLTYRMNPKETMEIQRQVEELISKGLMRETLCPYVLPALLVSQIGCFNENECG